MFLVTSFKTYPSPLLGCHKCLVPYRKEFLKKVGGDIGDFKGYIDLSFLSGMLFYLFHKIKYT